MESEDEFEDIVNDFDSALSDCLSSDEDYEPASDEWDSNDSDCSPVSKKSKVTPKRPTKETEMSSDEEDDNVPLACHREKRLNEQGDVDFNENVLFELFEAPMWTRMPSETRTAEFTDQVDAAPEILKSPYDYFCELVTDEMLESTAYETSKYAMSKSGKEIQTTNREIKIFTGVYLHMGLMKGHSLKSYWAAETHYPGVANVLRTRRDRFLKLARFIHFCDNNSPVEGDKVWKVRPWLESLSSNLEKIIPLEFQSIDEIMVAFKGRSQVKQYLRNKPKKRGFKLWARCGSDGILHDFDVYQGAAKTNSPLGVSGEVVLNMSEKLQKQINYKICADNFCSSLKLVQALNLKEQGFEYIGTIRENRLKGIELKSEKELKNAGRGAVDSMVDTDSNITVCRWVDNRKVDIISSFVGINPMKTVERYDKQQKQKIEIPCPAIVQAYNTHMGGVDKLDAMTALYKAKMKTQRGYIYIFLHTVNMAVVTSWLWYYKRHCVLSKEKPMPPTAFQTEVATALIMAESRPGRPSAEAVRSPPMPNSSEREMRPVTDARFDRVDHFPDFTPDNRRRCKNNGCNLKTFSMCSKCQVHLCLSVNRNCFSVYHKK